MARITAPDHAAAYCCSAESDDCYCKLYKKYAATFSFVYKIKCTCGCEKFIVYKDAHPSVFAHCTDCGNKITVYDLAFYPAAVKLNAEFPEEKICESAVYVNYEYSDEFAFEDDEFNANDVTWCKVFIGKDNNPIKIVDDETA